MNTMSKEEIASLFRFSQCAYVFIRAWESDWTKKSNQILEEYKKENREREALQVEGISMMIQMALTIGMETALFLGSETYKDLNARTEPKN